MTASSQPNAQPNAQLIDLLSPPLAAAHLELVDVEVEALGTAAATVRVLVEHLPEHPLGDRIDLDGVAAATRLVDEVLEAADPIAGAFTLEVSSPGLERPLRTPAHFRRFVGTEITLKTVPGTPGERRVQGRLERADDTAEGSVVVAGTEVAYAAIERARTVFVWGPAPKPAGRPKGAQARAPHPKQLAGAHAGQTTPTHAATEPEVTP